MTILRDSKMLSTSGMWRLGFKCLRKSIYVRISFACYSDALTFVAVDPLAYVTAKAHGLNEECEAILEASGLTEEDIKIPEINVPTSPSKAIVPTHQKNWPLRAASQSFFERALLGQVESMAIEDEAPSGTNGFGMDEYADDGKRFNGDLLDVEGEEDATGWNMGDGDLNLEQTDELAVETDGAGVGMSEAELWARNSPIAADHVAAGSFETAMQLLNRQVGAVNFEPLKPRFMEIYQASKTYLPATVGLPPLVNYVRRTVEETDSRRILPAIPRDLESVRTNDLRKGLAAMKANNLEEGVKIFRGVLHNLILTTVQNESEVEEVGLIPSYHAIANSTSTDRQKRLSVLLRSTLLPCLLNWNVGPLKVINPRSSVT